MKASKYASLFLISTITKLLLYLFVRVSDERGRAGHDCDFSESVPDADFQKGAEGGVR